jgi:hypothetical protein
MTQEDYRERASEFLSRAEGEKHPIRKAWLLDMARSWMRLAEQAVKNKATDVWYETPLAKAAPRPAQLQQQPAANPSNSKKPSGSADG